MDLTRRELLVAPLIVRVTRRLNNKTYVQLGSRKPTWFEDDASDLAVPFARPIGFPADAPESLAHYFTQFPKRLATTPVPANAATPGFYYQNYIKPGVIEGGTDHRRYGGFTRDWPRQTNLVAAGSSLWEQRDMEVEIAEAKTAGLTGFTLNMLSIRGFDGAPDTVGHWTRMKRMYDAATAAGNFKIIPMPDCKSGGSTWVKNADGSPNVLASADALANACNQLVKRPSQYRIGGKAVIAPYYPEGWPAGTPSSYNAATRLEFFKRFKQVMKDTYGEDILLWMCYVEQWESPNCAQMFDSISYGHGRWGDRDATSVASGTVNNGGAASYCYSVFKKKWMHFGGTPGDTRPNAAGASGPNYRTWERWGTRTLIGSWLVAINTKASLNQIPTWNDYTEHAHIGPSRNNTWALADLTAYFSYRYRTGYWPRIVRDCLYLNHKLHAPNPTMDPATQQVAFATLAGATPWKNEVEVLSFATKAGTVEILANGTVIKSQAVPEGTYARVSVALPAIEGAVLSARLIRDGSIVAGTNVVSEQPLDLTPLADDYHPRSYSSLRQALGQ